MAEKKDQKRDDAGRFTSGAEDVEWLGKASETFAKPDKPKDKPEPKKDD